jgi:hypothetical protein
MGMGYLVVAGGCKGSPEKTLRSFKITLKRLGYAGAHSTSLAAGDPHSGNVSPGIRRCHKGGNQAVPTAGLSAAYLEVLDVAMLAHCPWLANFSFQHTTLANHR